MALILTPPKNPKQTKQTNKPKKKNLTKKPPQNKTKKKKSHKLILWSTCLVIFPLCRIGSLSSRPGLETPSWSSPRQSPSVRQQHRLAGVHALPHLEMQVTCECPSGAHSLHWAPPHNLGLRDLTFCTECLSGKPDS